MSILRPKQVGHSSRKSLKFVYYACSLSAKSRYYKEGNVQSKKRQAIRRWFVSIRHGRHVLSQCPKQKHFPPVLVPFFNISGGWLPLFRALAKNMAPMTNADESPTNRLTLFPIYLSLFIVSTLCYQSHKLSPRSFVGEIMGKYLK